MKQAGLLLIGLFTIIQITGQDYFPIVQENKEWNVLHVGYNWNFTDTVFYTKPYKFEGDTTIDSINYVKVYKTSEEIPINWTFEGCIREDQDKKVFFRKWDMDYFKYDFGVDIGDTIEIYDNLFPVQVLVESFDSTYINGSFRKTILLSYLMSKTIYEKWIEGIGSNRGILQSGTANYVGGWDWLSCMTKNGELVYMNPNINSCYLISTGIEETKNSKIVFYPIPAKNKLFFENPGNFKIESISIIDLTGQKIKEFERNKTEFDLYGISAGIYILNLTHENGEIFKKIMIK
ncbi:MAG: T9SS type A sorting domain-containing protein [Bacteroidales bacterium]|nr:T9SS type A sorting domain-containing protein [Bacteroidales bacterium]